VCPLLIERIGAPTGIIANISHRGRRVGGLVVIRRS